MRRSWSTILCAVGLLGLIAVLGLLQYRWLGRVSEADAEQAKKRADRQAAQFAEDFNREVQAAYFNLQLDAGDMKARDWEPFNERFKFWLENTEHPDLISDIYIHEADSGATLKYDRAKREFLAAEPNPEVEALRASLANVLGFAPVYTKPLTLVLPVRKMPEAGEIRIRRREPGGPEMEKPEPNSGILFILMDPAVIRERILPSLSARYFGDGEFKATVVSDDGTLVFGSPDPGSADASARLFDMSPDTFMFFGNRELISKMRHGEPPPAGHSRPVVNTQVEAHTFSRIEEHPQAPVGGGTFQLRLQRAAQPKTSVFTATAPAGVTSPWMLQAQHASGSIDLYAAATLRRNLAIGFGLLLLVAAAAAAIIFSAQRARVLAQRQVDFVSSVSHEFRTPLAVIYSAGENLADGVTRDPEQIHRYGDLIKGEGRKLSAMVEQILEFAGAKRGRRFNLALADIGEIVDSAIAECAPLIRDRGIKVERSVAEKLPRVQADPTAISQAVQNLIANSVKYGGENGSIKVTAENGGGTVKISVEDSGIGISQKDLRKIFEPFYRAKDVVDAQIHGNGLGLSIVKQIAEGHGGRVTAASQVGKGSTFTIELKAAS